MTKDHNEQLETLRKWFPKGSTVYTILRHVSRSGMQRKISVVALVAGDDGQIIDLHPNYATSVAINARLVTGGHDTIVMNGCGMDMGFQIAYRLGVALYDDGDALKHRWL